MYSKYEIKMIMMRDFSGLEYREVLSLNMNLILEKTKGAKEIHGLKFILVFSRFYSCNYCSSHIIHFATVVQLIQSP